MAAIRLPPRATRNPGNNYYVVLWHRPRGMTRPAQRAEHRSPLSILPFVRRSDHGHGDELMGFAGMWVLYDEAHVTTIGVSPEYRGRGWAALLVA